MCVSIDFEDLGFSTQTGVFPALRPNWAQMFMYGNALHPPDKVLRLKPEPNCSREKICPEFAPSQRHSGAVVLSLQEQQEAKSVIIHK